MLWVARLRPGAEDGEMGERRAHFDWEVVAKSVLSAPEDTYSAAPTSLSRWSKSFALIITRMRSQTTRH